MGWTSIAMSMEPERTPLPRATCESEVIGNASLEGPTWRTVVDTSPCYCPYCRSIVDAAHPRDISPLAAIDVYSVPVEGDVLHAPDRSN